MTGSPDPGRPTRVLQIITGLRIGGAERLVVSAAIALPRSEFDVAICTLAERGPLNADADRAGVRTWCVDSYPGLRHPAAFSKLVRIIRAFRPDIVHTHLQSPNLYGRMAALIARVPVIVATEHNVYAGKQRRYVAVERWLARRTTALVAVSEEVRRFLSLQLGVDARSIRVLRNGVADPPTSADGIADLERRFPRMGGIIAATVASLTPKKGHEVLIAAAATLARQGVRCTFLCAGEGPERSRLEASAARNGVEESVRFLGEVRNVGDLLLVADLFVLPSLVEGLPLALLEAMRAAKPVVATRVGGVPEVVSSGVNGTLVEAGSADQLADAIAQLAADPNRRAALGAAARASVLQEYSQQQYLDGLSALYRQLVTG